MPARAASRPATSSALILAAIVWLGPSGLWSGHPVEVLIPLLWLGGRRRGPGGPLDRRRCRCSAWPPLIAPWAVLALPVAFVLADGRGAGASALAVAGRHVAGYLPFVLSGHFDLFDQVWDVEPRTRWCTCSTRRWRTSPGRCGWCRRSAAARWLPAGRAAGVADRRDALWAAPLVAVLLRILLDPVTLGYYWLPAGVLVIGGAALAPGADPPRARPRCWRSAI